MSEAFPEANPMRFELMVASFSVRLLVSENILILDVLLIGWWISHVVGTNG